METDKLRKDYEQLKKEFERLQKESAFVFDSKVSREKELANITKEIEDKKVIIGKINTEFQLAKKRKDEATSTYNELSGKIQHAEERMVSVDNEFLEKAENNKKDIGLIEAGKEALKEKRRILQEDEQKLLKERNILNEDRKQLQASIKQQNELNKALENEKSIVEDKQKHLDGLIEQGLNGIEDNKKKADELRKKEDDLKLKIKESNIIEEELKKEKVEIVNKENELSEKIKDATARQMALDTNIKSLKQQEQEVEIKRLQLLKIAKEQNTEERLKQLTDFHKKETAK
jgi:chromosome segregation ATPase